MDLDAGKGQTAVGRVPGGDGGSADVRESRDIPEGLVALGYETVGPIGTRNVVERICCLVVNGIIGDTRRTDGEGSGEDSDDRGEFHGC